MTDLPKDLRVLIAQARKGHDPDEATQARVRSSLVATLAAGASVAPAVAAVKETSTATTAPTVASSLTAKLASLQVWLWTGASVVVAGSGLWAASMLVGSSSSLGHRADAASFSQHAQESMVASGAVELERAAPAMRASSLQGQHLPARADQKVRAPMDEVLDSQGGVVNGQSVARRAHVRSLQQTRGAAAALPSGRPSALAQRSDGVAGSRLGDDAEASSQSTSETLSETLGATATAPRPLVPQRASLSTEIQLVRRATAAVGAGRFQAALAALNEHQARFPQGSLLEERLGLQAVSLCGLGHSAGVAHAERFEDAYPSSPLLERVRVACGTSR